MQVVGEPVVKLNTGILKCQVPSSMRHQADVISWKFGNNYIYPTKTWTAGASYPAASSAGPPVLLVHQSSGSTSPPCSSALLVHHLLVHQSS